MIYLACFAVALCIPIEEAMAGLGAGDPGTTTTQPMITYIFCIAAGWLSGPTARALGSIGLVILAHKAIIGRISWHMACLVGIGVATVFGAAPIVNNLSLQEGGVCYTAPSGGPVR